MGAEETDTEVPISEMAPRPDPGRQYVGWAGGVLQVCDDGGGSRATTTEAGGGIDDARTGLGDADIDGSSLAAEAGFGAELAGSEFRADVAPKEESVGMADELECESVRRRSREFWLISGHRLRRRVAWRLRPGFQQWRSTRRVGQHPPTRARVMGGTRLQSQRRLLPKWQGLKIFQMLRTVLGPRRGPTETLVQLCRQRLGRPGPMWAALIGTRCVS